MKDPKPEDLLAAAPAFLRKPTTTTSLAEAECDAKQGHAEIVMEAAAVMWAAYIKAKYYKDIPLTPEDVCWMMSGFASAHAMHDEDPKHQVKGMAFIGHIGRFGLDCPQMSAQSQMVQGGITPMDFANFKNLGGENENSNS